MNNYKEVDINEADYLQIRKESEGIANILNLSIDKKYKLKKDNFGEKYVINNIKQIVYPLSVVEGFYLKNIQL